MTHQDEEELYDLIAGTLYGADWKDGPLAHSFKPDVEAVLKLIHDREAGAERRGRIDELRHIDDPANVNVYFEGLIPIEKRFKQLLAQPEQERSEE